MRVFEDNFSVYGVRKMWKAMQRAGWNIGRDQTARVMKQALAFKAAGVAAHR